MKNYNLKTGLLKYNLIFYISEDFNEEYFTSLEDKRYFFKKRIEKSIQDLFNTKARVNNIVIEDKRIVIVLDNDNKVEVTKITPTELEYRTYTIGNINKFRYLEV